MKRSAWRKKIKAACIAAQTYQPFFDQVIDTLAGILETRDIAQAEFDEGGQVVVIEYTTKNGTTGFMKNPALNVLTDNNAQALRYWSELGLTSKSWKAINDGKAPEDTRDELTKVLANIGI